MENMDTYLKNLTKLEIENLIKLFRMEVYTSTVRPYFNSINDLIEAEKIIEDEEIRNQLYQLYPFVLKNSIPDLNIFILKKLNKDNVQKFLEQMANGYQIYYSSFRLKIDTSSFRVKDKNIIKAILYLFMNREDCYNEETLNKLMMNLDFHKVQTPTMVSFCNSTAKKKTIQDFLIQETLISGRNHELLNIPTFYQVVKLCIDFLKTTTPITIIAADLMNKILNELAELVEKNLNLSQVENPKDILALIEEICNSYRQKYQVEMTEEMKDILQNFLQYCRSSYPLDYKREKIQNKNAL